MTLRRPLVSLLVLSAAMLFAGCSLFHRSGREAAPAGPHVAGSFVYLMNRPLPGDATVVLQLVELDRNGAAVRTIVEDTLPRPRKVPQAFALSYDKRQISKRRAYGIAGRIDSGGRTIFATSRPIPVLTQGNPRTAEVVLEPVAAR